MAQYDTTICDSCGGDCTMDHLELTRDGTAMTLGAPMKIGGDERKQFCSPTCVIDFLERVP